MEITVAATSHTVICWRMEVPMPQRLLMARRLSKWVFSQTRLIKSLPTKSTTISEKYLLMMPSMGTIPKKALMGMGRRAVTAIFTGRSTHHSPIQQMVAMAAACLKLMSWDKMPRTTKNKRGPDKVFNERYFFMLPSPKNYLLYYNSAVKLSKIL